MTVPIMATADSLNRSQLAALRHAFTLWSQVYDHQANPLLSLEERFLSAELDEGAYADYRRRTPMLLPFWPKGA